MIDRVLVEADGGSRGNPGPAGYGAVVFDPVDGQVLAERNDAIGTETNNVAEYRGLIAGLEAARDLGAQRVAVRMDSKLVVEQMKGTWQIKNAALRNLARRASDVREAFEDVTFEWIPRERNKHADRLANEAMDRAAGKAPRSTSARAAKAEVVPAAVTSTHPAQVRSAVPAVPAPSWTPPTGRPTQFLLVRHGATEHSPAHRLSGRNDLPLSPSGLTQAAALGARSFGDVTAVVSSPLRRARQTAEAIAGPLGLDVRIADGLAEVDFGAWEGRTMAQVQAEDPAAVQAWLGDPAMAPPGGESFVELGQRVQAARDELVVEYPVGRLLLVTHVTPIKWLLRLALDAPPSALLRIFLDTASVSQIDCYPDGTCSVRLVNDTSHLH